MGEVFQVGIVGIPDGQLWATGGYGKCQDVNIGQEATRTKGEGEDKV